MGMKRNHVTFQSLDEPLRSLVTRAREGQETIFLEDGDGIAILTRFHETLHEFDFDLGSKSLPAWTNAEWERINKDFNDSFVEVKE